MFGFVGRALIDGLMDVSTLGIVCGRVSAGGSEDAFLGTWLLVENKNFEAILDRLGVSYIQRTAALSLKPSVTFEKYVLFFSSSLSISGVGE